MRIHLAGNDHVWRVVQSKKVDEMRIHFADTPPLQRMILSLMAGHPYRLVSYFYAKDLPDPKNQLASLVDNPRDLVMDSGLFSFMFGAEQGTMPATYEAYRDYTRRYLDDLANWGVDCHLVEADTQRLLGMDATLRLREEFKPLGSRVMYVWHRPEGFDGLIKLAREHDYICLSIPELRMLASGGKSSLGQSGTVERLCNDLIKKVYDACGDSPPRIHLLGCTVERMMETRFAWSCDSTSWLAGIRFGQGRIWTHNGLEAAGIRSEKFVKFVELAVKAHPEAAAFARSQNNVEYYLNCLACAHAYSLYQKWLDARYSPIPMRGDALPEGPIYGREASEDTASDGRTKNATRRRHRA